MQTRRSNPAHLLPLTREIQSPFTRRRRRAPYGVRFILALILTIIGTLGFLGVLAVAAHGG